MIFKVFLIIGSLFLVRSYMDLISFTFSLVFNVLSDKQMPKNNL